VPSDAKTFQDLKVPKLVLSIFRKQGVPESDFPQESKPIPSSNQSEQKPATKTITTAPSKGKLRS
jgi:hypothetical protein